MVVGVCGGDYLIQSLIKKRERKTRKPLKIVDSGQTPGILAYIKGNPIGWCSIAPREKYQRLNRSRILKRIDDKPVWSIVCFFVKKEFRNKGISFALLKEAINYAKQCGGTIVEGYPIEPKKDRSPDVFVYPGLASTFRKVGFLEVIRRSETRPIMRFQI